MFILGGQGAVRELSRPDDLDVGASGVTTGLSWLFYFKALQVGEVSRVAPVDKLSVAMAMVLAFVILGEAPDVKTIVGGMLIVAGSIVIIW